MKPYNREKQLKKADKVRDLSRLYAMGQTPGAPTAAPPKDITLAFLGNPLVSLIRCRSKRLRLKEMGFKTYLQYINGPHWQEFRRKYIASLPSGECEVTRCARKASIVHHRNYDRLGFELFDDVFYICSRCHSRVHRYIRQKRRTKNTSKPPSTLRCDLFEGGPGNGSVRTLQGNGPQFQPWGGLFAHRSVAVIHPKAWDTLCPEQPGGLSGPPRDVKR